MAAPETGIITQIGTATKGTVRPASSWGATFTDLPVELTDDPWEIEMTDPKTLEIQSATSDIPDKMYRKNVHWKSITFKTPDVTGTANSLRTLNVSTGVHTPVAVAFEIDGLGTYHAPECLIYVDQPEGIGTYALGTTKITIIPQGTAFTYADYTT